MGYLCPFMQLDFLEIFLIHSMANNIILWDFWSFDDWSGRWMKPLLLHTDYYSAEPNEQEACGGHMLCERKPTDASKVMIL